MQLENGRCCCYEQQTMRARAQLKRSLTATLQEDVVSEMMMMMILFVVVAVVVVCGQLTGLLLRV